jgi:hypothetical protein
MQPTLSRDSPTLSPTRTSRTEFETVAADQLQFVPLVQELNLKASRTSISIYAVLSKRGGVYCADFTGTGVPSSVEEVISRNHFGYTSPADLDVNITMSPLSPDTLYHLYCVSVSVTGRHNTSLSQLLTLGKPMKTLCCRQIGFTFKNRFMEEGISANAIAVVTVDPAAISEEFSLRLRIIRFGELYDALFPSVITISPGSPLTFAVAFNAAGCPLPGDFSVNISVTRNNSSVTGYEVIFPAGRSLRVLDADEMPPPPVMQYAQFSNDGLYVSVTFDVATDRGARIGQAKFPCSAVIDFDSVQAFVCQWSADATTLIIWTNPFHPLNAYARITLLAAAIRASCLTIDFHKCNSWPTTSVSDVTILPPAYPTKPVVHVSVPLAVGPYDSIALDFTGSVGSGGRRWLSVNILVTATAPNISSVVRALREFQATRTTDVIYLESTMLDRNNSYVFMITLCNFLNACGQSSATVTVMDTVIPYVYILGGALSLVRRYSSIELDAFASISAYDGSSRTTNLGYSWFINLNGNTSAPVTASFVSVSKDPSKFILKPFQLLPLHSYTVKVIVTDRLNGASSTAIISLFVLQSDLMVQLSGGTKQSVRQFSTTTIDASQSVDGDQVGSQYDGISFQWNCYEVWPQYVMWCPLETSMQASNTSVTIYAPQYSLNSTSAVYVCMFDTTRTASETVSLTVISQLSPVVTIFTSSSGKISRDEVYIVVGSVDTTVPCSCVWSVDAEVVDLQSASLVNPSTYLSPGSRNLYLRVKAGTFPAGANLLFQLSCSAADDKNSTGALSVMVNSPPSPGSCFCKPVFGLALTTTFDLSAQNWVDIDGDLPLSFQFGFYSFVVGGNMVVQSKSQRSTALSQFPEGSVKLVFQIFDSFDSQSVDSLSIKVMRAPNITSAFLYHHTLSLVEQAQGSVNSLKQAISVISETVNMANCSASPNCTLLNRALCSNVPNTCGECVSPQFVGAPGSSNTLCLPGASASTSGMNTTKSCGPKCSEHGTCAFLISDTLNVISTCPAYDPTCTTVCQCDDGFFGQDCSLDESTLHYHQSTVFTLLLALQQISDLESSTSSSVATSLNLLISLTVNPIVLTTEFLELGNSMTSYLLKQTVLLGQDAASVGEVLDNFGSAVFNTAVRFRQRRLTNATTPTTAWQALLDTTGSAVAEQMVPGEENRALVHQNFRLLAVSPAEPGNLTIKCPQTDLELLSVEPTTSAKLRAGPNAKLTFVTLPRFVVEATDLWSTNQQNITANAMRVASTISPENGARENCSISPPLVFTFIHYEQIQFGVTADNISVETLCQLGHSTTVSVNCSANTSIPVSCNGTSVYTVKTQCPQWTVVAVCHAGDRVCEVVNRTSASTTCSCSSCAMNPHVSPYISRRRLDDNIAASGVTVVALAEYSLTEYSNVMSSASDFGSLAALRSTTLVVSTFAVLWLGTVFSLVLISWWKYCIRRQKIGRQKSIIWPARTQTAKKLSPAECVQEYISELFGHAFSDEPSSKRLLRELAGKHEYMSVFSMDTGYEQWIGAFSLLTNLTASFFLLAVFFDIQFPNDDGSCRMILYKEACLGRKSAFNSAKLMCTWNVQESLCEWHAPDFDSSSVLAVSIIVLAVTAPISFALTFVCDMILLAPSLHEIQEAKAVLQTRRASAVDIFNMLPSPTGMQNVLIQNKRVDFKRKSSLFGNVNEMHLTLHRATLRAHQMSSSSIVKSETEHSQVRYREFARFAEDLKIHLADSRFSEIVTKERQLLHELVDEVGKLDYGDPHDRARAAATAELEAVVKAADAWAQKLKSLPPEQVGAQILEIFVCDCLGQHSRESIIFSNKVHLFTQKFVLTSGIKCLAFTLLILMNLYFVFACMLYGRDKGLTWQIGWFYACMVNVAVDVFINSVTMAAVIHYLVPNLILEKARHLRTMLSNVTRDLFKQGRGDHVDMSNGPSSLIRPRRNNLNLNLKKSPSQTFSPSEYYFVSVHLARTFPQLLESHLILANQSFPGYGLTLSDEQLKRINPTYATGDHEKHSPSSAVTVSVSGDSGYLAYAYALATTVAKWYAATILVFGSQSLYIQQLLISLLNPALVSLIAYFGMVIVHSSLGILVAIAVVAAMVAVLWILHKHFVDQQRFNRSTSTVAPGGSDADMAEQAHHPRICAGKVSPAAASNTVTLTRIQLAEQAVRYSKLPLRMDNGDCGSLGSYRLEENDDADDAYSFGGKGNSSAPSDSVDSRKNCFSNHTDIPARSDGSGDSHIDGSSEDSDGNEDFIAGGGPEISEVSDTDEDDFEGRNNSDSEITLDVGIDVIIDEDGFWGFCGSRSCQVGTLF